MRKKLTDKEDILFMQRCLQLANLGLGNTYPNPLVGAVIVKDRKIIGEGWHQKAGLPHAEVEAIRSVSEKNLLKESTIYVNLEPCNHFGKTPPCTEAIIQNGIGRVVIATGDKNPEVSGKGVRRLRKNRIEVLEVVLQKEADLLNKRFFTFHQEHRPYIVLKWAENALGQIGSRDESLGSVAISSDISRQLTHKWRSQEQAILIGKNTAIQDNPKLDTRLIEGKSPIRIILDPKEEISKSANVFRDKNYYLIVHEEILNAEIKENKIYINFKNEDFIANLLGTLFEINIQSLLVEGGQKTLQQFLDSTLWDEARVFRSNKNKDIPEAVFHPKFIRGSSVFKNSQKIGSDWLHIFQNSK